jgi:hypothetical protein
MIADVANPQKADATVKNNQPNKRRALAAIAVGKRACGEQQRGKCQDVCTDNPFDVGERRIQ